MSDREEDLELQALQKELDAAFETTRPRRGFEDELWLRMQSRRPFWTRLQDGLLGLVQGVREAPAIPAAAVAAALIVVLGAGIITLSGLRPGRGGTASLATQPGSRGGASFAAPGQAAAFGRVPAPVPESGRQATGPYAPSDQTRSNLYFGPANVTWAGELSVSATSAPVFRYHEPSTAAADQFAASLGATLQFRPAGYLGSYAGHDFTLQVRATVQAPAREPWFSLVASASAQPADGAAPADAAGAFLVAHSLAPAWPNVVTVDAAGDQAKVRYLRRFPVPAYGDAYLVDGEGERYGLEVDLNGGRLALVSGPLPVSLDFADYPIISADQAVRSALASSPAAPGNINPPPAVRLTAAELVYVVVAAGDHTFYEPAFLFSGSFLLGGMTYEKRVLVPAVDPSQRSS